MVTTIAFGIANIVLNKEHHNDGAKIEKPIIMNQKRENLECKRF